MPVLSATRKKRTPKRAAPQAPRVTQRSLARAFESFTQAAGSLEQAYGHLQVEVLSLRRELEQTNQELSASVEENSRMRAYLLRLLESLPCGVLAFDREGVIRAFNTEAHRLLGIDAESLSGPEEARSLLAALSGVAAEATGEESYWPRQEMPGVEHVGVTRARLLADETCPADEIFILRDLTAEKRAESERETARRMQALAEMSALLAHEIRNPLGSLELFAGLLADATEEETEVRQWVEHLQAGLRMLSATVNNVLQFYSQPSPRCATILAGRLLKDSVDFLKPLARQRRMNIEFSAPAGEMSIEADAQRLQQVFFNLALNAFRAMAPGGSLKIRAEHADAAEQTVKIEFEDNGAGIPEETLGSIFEAGFTTNSGSPGLGLAVCRKIIEQHGGRIEALSTPGERTVFTIHLPVARLTQ